MRVGSYTIVFFVMVLLRGVAEAPVDDMIASHRACQQRRKQRNAILYLKATTSIFKLQRVGWEMAVLHHSYWTMKTSLERLIDTLDEEVDDEEEDDDDDELMY